MNISELYRDDARARSVELSFGSGWLDRRRVPDPIPTRVAYMVETGELYAHGRDGLVQVLAVFPLERCRRCRDGCVSCLATGWSCWHVEEVLDGWELQERSAFGFAWLRRRTRAFRLVEGAA